MVEEFVEETRHMNNVGKTLFGKVTSIELLNKIYEKGLQNLFPRTRIALRILAPYQSQLLVGSVLLAKWLL